MSRLNQFEEYRIPDLKKKIPSPPLDIILVGVTGAGKSTTINALLGNDAAKIGYGVNPETKDIHPYIFNKYIRLWDTPGLGDSPENDKEYLRRIALHLQHTLVDMVLVIVDGSRRDLGTIYSLCNILLKKIDIDRVLFVVNQADMSMSGRHWDNNTAKPDAILSSFLDQQIEEIKKRIEANIHYTIHRPLSYSAANKYNINTLVDYILDNLCDSQRIDEIDFLVKSLSNKINI